MSRYFANGTEGHAWMDHWCDHCLNDHEAHRGRPDKGCPIVARSMLGDDPVIPEWVDESGTKGFTFPPAVTCLVFAPCTKCDPPKRGPRKPSPPHPDQGALFEADPALADVLDAPLVLAGPVHGDET